MRRALTVLLLSVLCIACRSERTLEIAQWTMRGRAVMLPSRFEEPIELQARVAIPPDWRGQPLTLVIPYYDAPAHLLVNGHAAPPLVPSGAPGS